MSNYTQRSRRSNRRNRTNTILNILIGVVVVLIIITVASIFSGGSDSPEEKAAETENEQVETDRSSEDGKAEEDSDEQQNDSDSSSQNDSDSTEQSSDDEEQEQPAEDSETVTLPDEGQAEEHPSDDPIVEKTITNPSWQPIGTSQSGNHVSSYDKNTVDWNEKVKALSYATGLPEDSMIVWFIGNGGGPHRSIGTVSSNDKKQIYRVYLQWVDGQGWQPEKMDVLNTLEGAY